MLVAALSAGRWCCKQTTGPNLLPEKPDHLALLVQQNIPVSLT